jgi:hypothetical protein
MRAPVTVTRKEVNISTYEERMVGRGFRPGASTRFIYYGNPPLWAGAPAAHPLTGGHIRTICPDDLIELCGERGASGRFSPRRVRYCSGQS